MAENIAKYLYYFTPTFIAGAILLVFLGHERRSDQAKESGKRPEYMRMLEGIRNSEYNAVLTWAPDRLSRNAGDLGVIVDLMDRGKLPHIKTYSQTFSNNPNEEFLLMILCSQTKLENDNTEYQR